MIEEAKHVLSEKATEILSIIGTALVSWYVARKTQKREDKVADENINRSEFDALLKANAEFRAEVRLDLERAKRELEEAKIELQRAKDRIATLENELESKQKQVDRLESELSKMRGQWTTEAVE